MPYFNMAKDIDFGSFIWDQNKELANLKLHNLDFKKATDAFFDPYRIIAIDEAHSKDEPRFFCLGKIGKKIATVRFTHRGDKIRIIGAGFWRKGRKFYEEKNKKSDNL